MYAHGTIPLHDQNCSGFLSAKVNKGTKKKVLYKTYHKTYIRP